MVSGEKEILSLLESVPDPELPSLNVVELGIVRGISREGTGVRVRITPTYSGCPAMSVIEESIVECLSAAGLSPVTIETVLSPPWTTDWLSEETKAKLRESGIAPPRSGKAAGDLVEMPTAPLVCPLCGSRNTELRSQFGSTACKSFYSCRDCLQPFEHFKNI